MCHWRYARRLANRSATEFGATANKQYRRNRQLSLLVQLTELLGTNCSPDRIRTGATALRGTGRYLTRWPADVQLRCQRVIPRQARGHASGTTPPLPLRCTAAHRERAPKSRAPRSSSSPTTSRARTCEQVHAARCRQARPARPSRTTRQDTETPWTLAPAGSYHACP